MYLDTGTGPVVGESILDDYSVTLGRSCRTCITVSSNARLNFTCFEFYDNYGKFHMNDFSMLARPKKYTLDHRVKITAKISLIQLPSTCKGLRPASPSLQLAPATSTRVAMAPPAPWKRHPRPFEAIPWEIPCSDMTPPLPEARQNNCGFNPNKQYGPCPKSRQAVPRQAGEPHAAELRLTYLQVLSHQALCQEHYFNCPSFSYDLFRDPPGCHGPAQPSRHQVRV